MSSYLTPSGYNREELYLHDVNQKLIDERREKLNQERKAREHEQNQKIHWMKCPKCGENMTELDMKNIKADVCTVCKGLFFDKGELDILLDSRDHGTFWSRLKSHIHLHPHHPPVR